MDVGLIPRTPPQAEAAGAALTKEDGESQALP